ncbi:hypothetical protein NESM_000733000 [Novymonas esmeraldas]|uniref:Transmembrane protein n=1 Tax=Novymonas esmeraldas TaxID=1808958 RepID=A0AAW0EVM4_9TRYP
MLRCCRALRAKAKPPPLRSTVHATSSHKSGKDRFDLFNALQKDRQRIERNRALPWRERLHQLNVYPWKFFLAFMLFWSWLGTYAVPYLKGMQPGELPSVGEGRPIPAELRAAAMPTPQFAHLKAK